MESKNTIQLNNYGFTLVELLVAVAILSVITVPIMKSFTTSAITSAKAQSMQNATSVAERVMEEVKTWPEEKISQYKEKDENGNPIFGSNARYSEDDIKDFTATMGEKFDVYVEFSDANYSEVEGKTDVSDINSVKLPELYAVDSDNHIVISWEVNSYDASAVENIAYEANANKDNVKNNIKKIINIEMTGGGATVEEGSLKYLPIKTECTVEYKYNTTSLKYTVFNSVTAYIPIEANKKSSGGPHLYLFYTPASQISGIDSGKVENETIKIKDTTEIPNVEGDTNTYNRDYYVIFQNPEGISDWPKVEKNGNGRLYTNIVGISDSVDNSVDTLYGTKYKQRIYDVKVKVYKAGTTFDSGWPSSSPDDEKKKLAELTSTMRVR